MAHECGPGVMSARASVPSWRRIDSATGCPGPGGIADMAASARTRRFMSKSGGHCSRECSRVNPARNSMIVGGSRGESLAMSSVGGGQMLPDVAVNPLHTSPQATRVHLSLPTSGSQSPRLTILQPAETSRACHHRKGDHTNALRASAASQDHRKRVRRAPQPEPPAVDLLLLLIPYRPLK
jgi:hypothetical protein